MIGYRERAVSTWASMAFSLALSAATVIVPLLAIEAGYTAGEIGAFVALSGLTQLVSRLFLGRLMRWVEDRAIIAAAAAALSVSALVLVVTQGVLGFCICMGLQGVARAGFWTAFQAHVVRDGSNQVVAVARMNLYSSVGMLCGPVLAGYLMEVGASAALVTTAILSLFAGLCGMMLRRIPVPVPDVGSSTTVWRRAGVTDACWAGLATGVWRGMLGSFVPVILSSAGRSPSTVGMIITLANVAVLIGSGLVARRAHTWGWVSGGTVLTGAGLMATGAVSESSAAVAVVLLVSGLGAGLLQTLSPALAAQVVPDHDRADAIVATGTFRAGGLFVGPLALSGGIATIGLSVSAGLLLVGGLVALPGLKGFVPAKEGDREFRGETYP